MTKHHKKQWQWTKSNWAKRLFSFFRWLHVYLSTAAFSLLIFFSVTGFTLNHTEWFNSENKRGTETVTVPQRLQAILATPTELSIHEITGYIKDKYGLKQPKSINLDLDIGELSLDYPIPSGYVFITFFIESNEMEIEYQTGTLISIINDLHKGRHSGSAWSWLIDVSAWTIILFSLAGLFILLQHRKRRVAGLLAVLAGTLSPFLIYLLWVPKFH
jgi:hypothetical protein